MNNKDRTIFFHMLEYCQRILTMRERFGDSFAHFSADCAYQDATSMCILQIGELAGKLSQETRDAIPQIPWRAIRGLRNVFAHDYGSVVLEIMWETVANDLPALESEIRRVLEE